MVTLVAFILLCVCVIIIGAKQPNPVNYAVVAMAVLALLLCLLGKGAIHLG
jgi:hypothetical protein